MWGVAEWPRGKGVCAVGDGRALMPICGHALFGHSTVLQGAVRGAATAPGETHRRGEGEADARQGVHASWESVWGGCRTGVAEGGVNPKPLSEERGGRGSSGRKRCVAKDLLSAALSAGSKRAAGTTSPPPSVDFPHTLRSPHFSHFPLGVPGAEAADLDGVQQPQGGRHQRGHCGNQVFAGTGSAGGEGRGASMRGRRGAKRVTTLGGTDQPELRQC